jgi:hypothetical protein
MKPATVELTAIAAYIEIAQVHQQLFAHKLAPLNFYRGCFGPMSGRQLQRLVEDYCGFQRTPVGIALGRMP